MADTGYKQKNLNVWNKIGIGLLAAGGEDITKYLASREDNEFQAWKQEQDIAQGQATLEAKIAGENLIPDPQGAYQIGGKTYSKRPPILPDFSKLNMGGGTNGLGMTGGSYNPQTGEFNVNIGETPMAKDIREREAKISGKISEEAGAAGNALTLLDSLEKDWLATTPPKAGMLGIGESGLMPQPIHGISQRIGSEFQFTRNQRADRVYVRRVKALQSRLAKGVIGQDVGNLSVYEQAAAQGGVAGLSDTYETGKQMFEKARQMVVEMKDARAAGYKSLDEKLRAEGRILTSNKAVEYLKQAGGDRNKARQLAIQDRWAF